MTVVLDCNIIVMSLSPKSPYHIIYQSLVKGKFQLAVTADILLEYEEIIQRKYSIPTAGAFLSLLNELPNVHHVTAFYKWMLIVADPDDNKYIDCAVAGQAEYLVTEDRHFSVLKTIKFPLITTISIDVFMGLLVTGLSS